MLHLPSVDSLVDMVKDKGLGCLLYKQDLKQAYRQIPVDPGDIHVLGYMFQGHLYFDRVLPMGLRSSCQACQRVTNAVAYAFGELGFGLVNYIDDLAGAESQDRAEEAFASLGSLLDDLGLGESLNKACSPSTAMSFLGIQFDTVSGTLSIPQDKLQEICDLLKEWLGKVSASRKEVQSLMGSLNFLAACVCPGRFFFPDC